MQTALHEQLARDAGAMPAFITGLRQYLHQPLRLKRLLQPCVGTDQPAAAAEMAAHSSVDSAGAAGALVPAAAAELHDNHCNAATQAAVAESTTAQAGVDRSADDDAATGSAQQTTGQAPATHDESATMAGSGVAGEASAKGGSPCLLSLLTGIAPLRPALVDLLVDTMVAACQHARGCDRAAAGCADATNTAQPSAAATRESRLSLSTKAVAVACRSSTPRLQDGRRGA